MYMNVFPHKYMYVCTMYMPVVHGHQKRLSDSVELELQVVVSPVWVFVIEHEYPSSLSCLSSLAIVCLLFIQQIPIYHDPRSSGEP